jgi:hypothetical protein
VSSCNFEGNSSTLSSPYRNFTFLHYPILHKLHSKLSNCGVNSATFINKETLEEINVKLFCDNRGCLNPECQKHRLYKFMREHNAQIRALNKHMKKPKGWVFTTPKKPYPIDRFYCQEKFKELYYLLDRSKHKHYGSNSMFSIHMEIKLHKDSWYMHFHGALGGITNLKLVRKLWGFQIKYEEAINPIDLGYYISKYASKMPNFPNKQAYLEYISATYKLQMHRFNCEFVPVVRVSDWVIKTRNNFITTNCFYELEMWLDKYLNDFGYGG